MRHAMLAFILLFSSLSWGLSLKVKTEQLDDGSYSRIMTLQCLSASDQHLCLETCGEKLQCLKTEPVCYSCIGTQSEILKNIFTKNDSLYYVDFQKELDPSVVVEMYHQDRLIILDSVSTYNFYLGFNNAQDWLEFSRICGAGVNDVSIGMQISLFGAPEGAKFVICENEMGKQKIYEMSSREGDILSPISKPLRLQLKYRLNLQEDTQNKSTTLIEEPMSDIKNKEDEKLHLRFDKELKIYKD